MAKYAQWHIAITVTQIVGSQKKKKRGGILSLSEVSLPTSCKTQSSLSESFVDSKSSLVSEVEQFESLAVDTLAKADNFYVCWH